MTSQDVRDAFNLPASAPIQPKKKPKKPPVDPVIKNATGVTRELYALLGEHTAPIAFLNQDKFKEKPKFTKKVTPWVWAEFENPARPDGLRLKHYVRKHDEDENVPYRFAKFNVKVDVPQFTDKEYAALLEDPDWTMEETTYLFDLCNDFDLRFVVIHDRYEWEGKTRSIEDLKARYYGCARKILATRTPIQLMTASQLEYYNSLNFNKGQEQQRKVYLNNLFNRSPEQIAEEAALIGDVKRLQVYDKKMKKDREALTKLLEFPRPVGDARAYEGSQGMAALTTALAAQEKGRLQQVQKQPSRRFSTVANETSRPQVQEPGLNAKEEVSKRIRKLSPKEETAYGVSYPDKPIPGYYLRSTKNVINRAALQAKVIQVMREMSISERLTMPTALVCEKQLKLQDAITLMLDAKKGVDKVDQDIRIQLMRNGNINESLRDKGFNPEGVQNLLPSGTQEDAITPTDTLEKRKADNAADENEHSQKRQRNEMDIDED